MRNRSTMEKFIYKNTSNKPYRVIVTHNGKRYNGGVHVTISDAIESRDRLVREINKPIDVRVRLKVKQTIRVAINMIENILNNGGKENISLRCVDEITSGLSRLKSTVEKI